jgi:hypothetical protein
LFKNHKGIVQRHRTPLSDPLAEGLTFQVFHDQVRDPTLGVDPKVCHFHNVRVPQATENLGFPPKAGYVLPPPGDVGPQDLDGDEALQSQVPALVDMTTAASTEQLEQSILPVENRDSFENCPQGSSIVWAEAPHIVEAPVARRAFLHDK